MSAKYIYIIKLLSSAGFTIVLRCAQGPVDQGGPSSCQFFLTMDFSLYGAILNLKGLCFGAIGALGNI